jgi:GTPase SAR1 family protein
MHWRFHLLGANAIIFMVDISDQSKFEHVKMELDGLVSNRYIKTSVIFILLNKRDLVKERYVNENEILLKINISNR